MAGNQENVGYSIEGCEGLYNILMMGDFQDVWAVGAGAVTKLLSPDRNRYCTQGMVTKTKFMCLESRYPQQKQILYICKGVCAGHPS